MMMRRHSCTCAGEESKLLFLKTKETERREKEEGLENNKESYAKISAVERFFSRIKMGFRRIILRYERLDRVFRALVIIATFFIYWEKLQEKL